MKWKVELTGEAALISQMAFLFYAWWSKWLVEEGSEIQIALIVMTIGFLGGILMWIQKPINNEGNKYLLNIVRWVGAIISTIGVYLVFIPVMLLIFHSTITALILIFGFFSPLFIYTLPPLKSASNA